MKDRIVPYLKLLGTGVKMQTGEVEAVSASNFNETLEEAILLRVNQRLQSDQLQALSNKVKTLYEQQKALLEQLDTEATNYETMSGQQMQLSQQLSEQEKILPQHIEVLSEVEALIFEVSGYTSKKEAKTIFYSVPFYTHCGGYKMCVCVDAGGCDIGTGTHLSVFTKILKGRYDNQLSWPFIGTVTYELLNQLSDRGHFKRVYTFDINTSMHVGSSWGFPQFFPHSSLYHYPATNTQYLLGDTLYFRVSVKVDNHKPWLVCTDKINMESLRMMYKKKVELCSYFYLLFFFFFFFFFVALKKCL